HADANDDLHDLAARIRARGDYQPVLASFLELAEPDMLSAGRSAAASGTGRVILLPYFLSAGIHVRRDLTAARDRLAQEHPGVAFVLAEPLGRHPLLLDLVLQRAAECG